MRAAVGMVAATDGQPSRRVVQSAIDALKAVWHRGGVECGRQDRRRCRPACRSAAPFLRRCDRRVGAQGPAQPAGGRHDLHAAHRSGRAGNLPHHRRERHHRGGLHHLWLAPGAGRRLGHRHEGAGDAPRDRADHDRRADARRARDRGADQRVSTSVRCPAARSSTRGCSSPRACRSSIPTCRTIGSRAAWRSSTSVIRPTPSRNGGWRSPSAAWRITVRSTRSAATRTGCSATRSGWPRSRSRQFGGYQAGDLPFGPRRADRQADAGARGVAEGPRHAQGACRDVPVSRLRHGAVGRPRRAGDDRWPLGGGGHGPQRAAPAALHADRRRPADRGFGKRHGRGAGSHHHRQGASGAGADDRRRSGRGQAVRRPRNQGPDRGRTGLCRDDRRVPDHGPAAQPSEGEALVRDAAAEMLRRQ
ncbi:Glutamate synthase [NADPH] large chain, partial [Schistosoma japonicum]